jgi:hypothetical protein
MSHFALAQHLSLRIAGFSCIPSRNTHARGIQTPPQSAGESVLKVRNAAIAFAIAAGSILGCHRWVRNPSSVFFPLRPRMMWVYQIQSKSQQASYTMTDLVVGPQFVPALKLTGAVVQEFYNLDRAGLRPIVYFEKDGYLTRLSGLDYVRHEIKAPNFGRSEEPNFLPENLLPDQIWSNKLFPYGRLAGAFDIVQDHRSFKETGTIQVPAGRFNGCIRIETAALYEGGPYKQQKRNLKLAYEDWYAPDVGMVRTIAYQGGLGGPEMERVELLRFDPGVRPVADSAKPAPAASPGR